MCGGARGGERLRAVAAAERWEAEGARSGRGGTARRGRVGRGAGASGRRWCSSPAPSASRAGPPGAPSPRSPRMVDGVSHVEIDAEDQLDLVRELGILKTPTVLVLDAAGRDRAPGLRPAPQGGCDRRAGTGGVTSRDTCRTLRTHLTARAMHRHADAVPPELLLHGRAHVDLVRTASARCPGCLRQPGRPARTPAEGQLHDGFARSRHRSVGLSRPAPLRLPAARRRRRGDHRRRASAPSGSPPPRSTRLPPSRR